MAETETATYILLRTASSLARACQQAAARIEIESTIKLSVHTVSPDTTDISVLLDNMSRDHYQRVETVMELYDTQRMIRELIGEANAKTVNRLLTEREYLNNCEKLLVKLLESSDDSRRYRDQLSTVEVEHNVGTVIFALNDLRTRLGATQGGLTANQVELPTMCKNHLDALVGRLASIRRRRAELMDKLAAANLHDTVALPPKVVEFLKTHGIM